METKPAGTVRARCILENCSVYSGFAAEHEAASCDWPLVLALPRRPGQREQHDAVLKGLHVIAETTRRFVEAAFGTGIEGIFYAVQHAQAQLLTWDEYSTFGLPFDRQAAPLIIVVVSVAGLAFD